MSDFTDLIFGYASAEQEDAWDARLLAHGFYDLEDAIDRALSGPRFLFLGPKGSGKSAIAIRLTLLSASDPMLFVSYRPLASVPFHQYSEALGTVGSVTLSTTWAIILRLAILASISNDEGARHHEGEIFHDAISALKSAQLLPNDSSLAGGWSATTRSVKAGLDSTLHVAVEQSWAHTQGLSRGDLAPYLTRLLNGVRTSSRHLVIIDDVDELLMDERLIESEGADAQTVSLAALISEAKRLNNEAAAAGLDAKVLVMCRSDVYDMWTGPNQNKIRQDSAVYIDWASHGDQDDPSRHLVALCNMRAQLVDPNISDVFRDFLPSTMADGEDATHYLLRHTRYTPRDLLRLMTYIRDESKPGSTVSPGTVMAGVTQYAKRYFLHEIQDEMAGHVRSDSAHNIIATIRAMRESVFDFRTLYTQYGLSGYLADVDDDPRDTIVPALETMFECGAIGNVDAFRDDHTGGRERYRFIGDESQLNIHDELIVHPALCRALGISYDG